MDIKDFTVGTYVTEQEALDAAELNTLRESISKALDWINIRIYSLEQLRAVAQMLNIE